MRGEGSRSTMRPPSVHMKISSSAGYLGRQSHADNPSGFSACLGEAYGLWEWTSIIGRGHLLGQATELCEQSLDSRRIKLDDLCDQCLKWQQDSVSWLSLLCSTTEQVPAFLWTSVSYSTQQNWCGWPLQLWLSTALWKILPVLASRSHQKSKNLADSEETWC